MMERLMRAVRAGLREWREPRGLRNAQLHISPDGRLLAVSFEGKLEWRDRENIAREFYEAFQPDAP